MGTILGAFIVGILYSLSRVFWFVRYGVLGFGYDTGIYRHIINGYWEKRGQNLVPFGFARITNFFRWLGIPTDFILIGGYMLAAVLLGVAVYLVLKKNSNRRAGLIGVFLVATSLTQIEFYHWFYFRNLLAAGLVLLAIAYCDRPWLSGVLLGLVGIIHPISLVPIVCVLVVRMVRNKLFTVTVLQTLIVAGVITLIGNWSEWLLYLKPFWQYRGLTSKAITTSPEFSGQFISWQQWLRWSWPYVSIAIPGIWLARRTLALLWGLGLLAIVGVAVQVLFYRRLVVWLDLAAIIGAAIFVEYVWQRWRLAWIVAGLCGVGMIVYASMGLVRYAPAMSQLDWLVMQQLNSLPPQSLVMTITSQYAPWLYGYTNQRIIAPGMLDENVWNQAQWKVFWNTRELSERAKLLTYYPEPQLYIFLGHDQTQFGVLFDADPQFTPLSTQIWQYTNPGYPHNFDSNK